MLETARATIKGFEVIYAMRKGQPAIFNLATDVRREDGMVERASASVRGPSSKLLHCVASMSNSRLPEWDQTQII